MPKLTKRFVDGISPSPKEVIYWDETLKGFGLRILPSGVATFIYQYRNKTGRTRKGKIGRLGVFTPDEARAEARQVLARVSLGEDPVEERMRAAQSSAHTVSDLCDLYVKAMDAGEVLNRKGVPKSQSTIEIDKGRIERHIKPLLGRLSILEVSGHDVEQSMYAIARGETKQTIKTKARGKAVVRGGKGAATRTVGLLGSIFSFAIRQRLRSENPVHGVKRFADSAKARFLNGEEQKALGTALRELEAEANDREQLAARNRRKAIHPFAMAIIRLLLLTGCRKSEIAALKWDAVDTERKCLRLSEGKTGGRSVPLGQAAIDLLAALPRFHSPFVFPAVRGDGPYKGMDRLWRSEIRAQAGLPDVRIHDLRHTFASVAAELGYSEPTIGALLGNAGGSITSRYIHFGQDPLGAAATHIGGTIAARMEGGAEIVQLNAGTPNPTPGVLTS